MLTRITDWKILCVYIHVYQITKNWGPGRYNSLCHADNRRYFSGLSLMWNQREAHMFYLVREVGKVGHVLAEKWLICWEMINFTMINEFKYGQTWKILPSPLNLSLYNPFKFKIAGQTFNSLKQFLFSEFVNGNGSLFTSSVISFIAERPAAVMLSSPDNKAFLWLNFNSDNIIYRELSERFLYVNDWLYCFYIQVTWLFITVSTALGILWDSNSLNFNVVVP